MLCTIQVKITTLTTTYERDFLKKEFSWTSINLFYIFFRYLWKSSQVLSRKVFQTSAGLTKALAAESFPSDKLEPCHLIKEWTRKAWDSSDTLVYAHHEIKLLEKLWKYINANHSSVRQTVKGNSCAMRHSLKCMDKRSLSIFLAFPVHWHCSLFEANTSGQFLKTFPRRLSSLYVFQGKNQKLLINNNDDKKTDMGFLFCFKQQNSKKATSVPCLSETYLFKGKKTPEVPRVCPKGHFTEVTAQHTSDVAILTT